MVLGGKISLFIKGWMRVISAPFSCQSRSLEKSLHRTTIYTDFVCDLLNRQTIVSEGGDFSLGTWGQNRFPTKFGSVRKNAPKIAVTAWLTTGFDASWRNSANIARECPQKPLTQNILRVYSGLS